jgi:hypothetical protein
MCEVPAGVLPGSDVPFHAKRSGFDERTERELHAPGGRPERHEPVRNDVLLLVLPVRDHRGARALHVGLRGRPIAGCKTLPDGVHPSSAHRVSLLLTVHPLLHLHGEERGDGLLCNRDVECFASRT